MRLKRRTSSRWTQVVLHNFDAFLIDHAACERKASATAMSLVAHYPNREKLVSAMIDMALEELDHFKQVYHLMEQRNLQLGPDTKDPYIAQMLKLIRKTSSDVYFCDRLLTAGVIEARGCERFGILAENLEDAALKNFYMDITRSEARHHGLFVRLANEYFDSAQVEYRLEEILEAEASIVMNLEFRPAVH